MDFSEFPAEPERLVNKHLTSRLKLYMAATYVIAMLMGAIKMKLGANPALLIISPLIGLEYALYGFPYFTVPVLLLVLAVLAYGLLNNKELVAALGSLLLAAFWLCAVYWCTSHPELWH
jgi:hypothetical protein